MFPERTLSNFDNVSIGTGLAFETLFKPDNGYYDPEREIPKLKESYRVIWLNGYTILRGIISSISTTEDKNKFLDKKDEYPSSLPLDFIHKKGTSSNMD